jgi:hypothetical protein
MDRKLGRLTIAALAVAAVAGCTVAPVAPPDYGDKPSVQAAEAEVNKYFRMQLRDPDSMKDLVINEPDLACYPRGLINGGGQVCGHRVCASVNAKNAYGGYTGSKVYVFWFRGDRIDGGVFPNAGACPPYLDPDRDWRKQAP